MAYDFSTLSPHDFELLTQDLLQRECGVRLEGFKSGRDGGIDLRCSRDQSNGLVVQCKHYHRSTFAQLKRNLQKSELAKVAKLSPKRYVVTTSRPLSVKEKDMLAALLAPYCLGTEDILGAEDLNALLRKHSDIEQKHFKLWVASTAVLQAVLNNDLFSRSYLETSEIKTRLSLFVPTDAVTRAMKLLQERGFCLLSGIPGIGKTTTAEMLVALMLGNEWECVCVSSNVSEAFRVYNADRRQVFYYDDFLGQTSLAEKLGKNEDHDLNRLIQTCGKLPNSKRLILTTRDYLLTQAIEQHEVLGRARLDAGTCVVELADYTLPVRAKILVNHLWFYGVKETWCRKLIESGTARKLVDHVNYSPRLIEAICRHTPEGAKTQSAFAKAALAMLDDPTELWRHAYQHQLSENARELLVCFASLGNDCRIAALQCSYQSFAGQAEDDLLASDVFHRAMRELEGSFLRIASSGKLRTVAYNNPSVKDFMDGVYASTTACSTRVLKTATHYNQVGYAARHLLQGNSDRQAEELVCTALRKHLLGVSAVPDRIQSGAIGDSPTQPAQRLLAWRRSYRETRHKRVFAELVTLAIGYLNGLDYKGDHPYDIAELLRLSSADRTLLSIDVKIDANAVEKWLWSKIRSPDDYRALGWWINDWEEGESKLRAQERLRDGFIDVAESILDDLANGEHSSSDIEDGIQELRDVARELNMEDSDLDTDDAEDAKEAAEEREDAEADMRQEEWSLDRHEERESEREIDDILDSLR